SQFVRKSELTSSSRCTFQSVKPRDLNGQQTVIRSRRRADIPADRHLIVSRDGCIGLIQGLPSALGGSAGLYMYEGRLAHRRTRLRLIEHAGVRPKAEADLVIAQQ